MKIEAGLEATEKLEAAEAGELELTRAECVVLRALRTGLAAKQALISANPRLVEAPSPSAMLAAECCSGPDPEGNLGRSAPSRSSTTREGFKFSTYATWWDPSGHYRAIADQARTIRIPVHMVETINKLVRVQRQLLQDGPRPDLSRRSVPRWT